MMESDYLLAKYLDKVECPEASRFQESWQPGW